MREREREREREIIIIIFETETDRQTETEKEKEREHAYSTATRPSLCCSQNGVAEHPRNGRAADHRLADRHRHLRLLRPAGL